MSKMTLDMGSMQDEFFADTALIGIVSALPAYRFCWLLNRKFGIDLVRDSESDLHVRTTKNESHYFPIYRYNIPLNSYSYTVYRLKSDKETLLPEIKQLDYLWMIQSMTPEAEADTVTRHLRQLPEIQLAQILSTDKLKHLSHLLV